MELDMDLGTDMDLDMDMDMDLGMDLDMDMDMDLDMDITMDLTMDLAMAVNYEKTTYHLVLIESYKGTEYVFNNIYTQHLPNRPCTFRASQ